MARSHRWRITLVSFWVTHRHSGPMRAFITFWMSQITLSSVRHCYLYLVVSVVQPWLSFLSPCLTINLQNAGAPSSRAPPRHLNSFSIVWSYYRRQVHAEWMEPGNQGTVINGPKPIRLLHPAIATPYLSLNTHKLFEKTDKCRQRIGGLTHQEKWQWHVNLCFNTSWSCAQLHIFDALCLSFSYLCDRTAVSNGAEIGLLNLWLSVS